MTASRAPFFGGRRLWIDRRLQRCDTLCRAAALILLASAGCSTTAFTVPKYLVTPATGSTHLLLGARIVDITPEAGYPMGGHSLAGRVSRGHWGRLYARAFYFQDHNGSSVAIVACDLFAMPGGLQQQVAQLLHEGQDQVADIGRDNLIIAASHTHQSPGNFMTSAFYNSQSSPYTGFDQDLFKRLAATIAGAIKAAALDARTHPEPGKLSVFTTTAPKLVRNRAVKAFENNSPPTKAAIVAHGPPPAPPECPSPCPRYQAIDPTITIVRLERQAPIGILVFFASHPTVLRHDAPVYSADFVGLAMRALERQTGTNFVAGFINGAEGDVSPRWIFRDAEEARDLGEQFKTTITAALAGSPETVLGDTTEITAARAAAEQEVFCGGAAPVLGVAAMGGAEDGRFVTFDVGWRAPYRRAPNKPRRFFLWRWLLNSYRDHEKQGRKEPVMDFQGLPFLGVTKTAAPANSFPGEVPVSIANIGSLSLLAVPVELTTATGYELREKIQEQLPNQTLLIAGLANEYYEYVATEGEYCLQEYEGASTLFGPETAHCYQNLLGEAAKKLRPVTETRIPAVAFDPGTKPLLDAKFGTSFWGEEPPDSDEELFGSFVRGNRPSPWPTLAWEGAPDTGTEVLVHVGPAWATQETDDQGRLLTIVTDGGKKRWETIWLPPEKEDPKIEHRLKIHVGKGSICSETFTLDAVAAGSIPFPLPVAATCP